MKRFMLFSCMGLLMISGCGGGGGKGMTTKEAPNPATQQIKSPELKHLLDYHKQKRQIEDDLQTRVRQEEIHPSSSTKESSGDGSGKSSSADGNQSSTGQDEKNKKESTSSS